MVDNDKIKSMENLMFGNSQQQQKDSKPCRACVDFKNWKRQMTTENSKQDSKEKVCNTFVIFIMKLI